MKEKIEEVNTAPPIEETDFKELELQTLRDQVKTMEDFANVVVGQRNEAQNMVAQLQAQIIRGQRQ